MHKSAKLQPKKFVTKRQLLNALTRLLPMLSVLDKMRTRLPSIDLWPPRRRLSQSPKHLYQILYLVLIPLHHFHSSNRNNTRLSDAFFRNTHLSSDCILILICRNHHRFHNSNRHLSDTLLRNTHLSRNCNNTHLNSNCTLIVLRHHDRHLHSSNHSNTDLFHNTHLSNNTNISLRNILSNHPPKCRRTVNTRQHLPRHPMSHPHHFEPQLRICRRTICLHSIV